VPFFATVTPSAEKTPPTEQRVDPPPQPRSLLGRFLREPLLHFLLLGVILFGISFWRNRQPEAEAGAKQIVLTEDDLLQMVVAWRAQGRPEPTSEQFQAMLAAKIREEVLYREALGMGLDKDDTIVKRRMAQKMDFLAEDLSALREPTREELQAWLKAHPQDFAYPARLSFRHLYFSPDKRQARARDDAAEALAKAAALGADSAEAANLGDRFMFQDSYADRTPDQVTTVFGPKFARALFEQKPGTWAGPVESGFGWHLVFVDSLTPGRLPEFEEIEGEVKTQWVANQRAEFKRTAFETMRAKYQVILPARPEEDGAQKKTTP
jgi:parvulin-like peptidyl-prolyl isomerase